MTTMTFHDTSEKYHNEDISMINLPGRHLGFFSVMMTNGNVHQNNTSHDDKASPTIFLAVFMMFLLKAVKMKLKYAN